MQIEGKTENTEVLNKNNNERTNEEAENILTNF
jgi:hypothetical protein